ncbi:hypothetical protein BN165_990015 [Clostridioides difficile E1]|nr:hypothetical protein BN163_1070015 [Clostridioides difficile T5]CCK93989.1 hypothetical protein BN164_970015 [Clostridioides difficile T20]CCK97725.1 hypothetical protein BN165_990015 [Clostridioides difficile E1]CCK98154.1 hypothetical protein BN166_1220015 [Clostridioides difficile E10]
MFSSAIFCINSKGILLPRTQIPAVFPLNNLVANESIMVVFHYLSSLSNIKYTSMYI